jgi:hypothetical protein
MDSAGETSRRYRMLEVDAEVGDAAARRAACCASIGSSWPSGRQVQPGPAVGSSSARPSSTLAARTRTPALHKKANSHAAARSTGRTSPIGHPKAHRPRRTSGRCDDARVFVERVVAPREEFELWDARLRIVTDPPPALVVSVAWESDGEVTCINVWDSPEAIADFFLERVRPFIEAADPPENKPQRLGHVVRAYVRPG